MARLKSGSVPSYRRHNSRDCAVVTLDGKDHYLGQFNSRESRDRYDRLIAEWLVRGRSRTVPPPPPVTGPVSPTRLTVAELILAYWHHALDFYQDSPAERERIRLAVRPLRRLYGRTPAVEFGPLKLRTVRQQLQEVQTRTVDVRDATRAVVGERTVSYRLSRTTINQRIGVIKRLFKWASSVELVPVTIYEALRTVEGLKKGRTDVPEGRKVRPVPDELYNATLPHLGRHVRCMAEFQRFTGARSGEVCRMRRCDIDMTGAVWVYRPAGHKTEYRGQDRVIHIGPRAQEVLRSFLAAAPTEYLFSPARATQELHADLRRKRRCKVYPSSDRRRKSKPKRAPGHCYSVRAYRQAIQRACRRSGLPVWHPHRLRHTTATALRSQFGVETARIVLGHSSAFTTEIYAEADMSRAAVAMSTVG
jgi:integrase